MGKTLVPRFYRCSMLSSRGYLSASSQYYLLIPVNIWFVYMLQFSFSFSTIYWSYPIVRSWLVEQRLARELLCISWFSYFSSPRLCTILLHDNLEPCRIVQWLERRQERGVDFAGGTAVHIVSQLRPLFTRFSASWNGRSSGWNHFQKPTWMSSIASQDRIISSTLFWGLHFSGSAGLGSMVDQPLGPALKLFRLVSQHI